MMPEAISWPTDDGRTPHGVRGLKSPDYVTLQSNMLVAPLTGCVD